MLAQSILILKFFFATEYKIYRYFDKELFDDEKPYFCTEKKDDTEISHTSLSKEKDHDIQSGKVTKCRFHECYQIEYEIILI